MQTLLSEMESKLAQHDSYDAWVETYSFQWFIKYIPNTKKLGKEAERRVLGNMAEWHLIRELV